MYNLLTIKTTKNNKTKRGMLNCFLPTILIVFWLLIQMGKWCMHRKKDKDKDTTDSTAGVKQLIA